MQAEYPNDSQEEIQLDKSIERIAIGRLTLCRAFVTDTRMHALDRACFQRILSEYTSIESKEINALLARKRERQERREREHLLYEFHRMEQEGVPMTRRFDHQSSLAAMRMQYEKLIGLDLPDSSSCKAGKELRFG